MSYFPTIPASTDKPSTSQAQIQQNFTTVNTDFSVDHVALTTGGADFGYHKKITFDGVQADPTLSFPYTELYTKTSGGGFNDLFYYQKNSGATINQVLQLTGGGITAAAWCVFDGTAGSSIMPFAQYNISGNVSFSSNIYTLRFLRNFTGSYAVVILPSLNVSTPVAIQLTASTSNLTFTVRTGGTAGSGGNYISVVCFGTLA
jgi:hypothetical protein